MDTELLPAANAGDLAAKRELGRLHTLLPDGEAERWLRAALADDPDDVVVATLLATRLTQQIELMTVNEVSLDDDEDGAWEEAAEQRRDEALDLFGHALAVAPGDPAALAGLAVLREVLGEWEDSDPAPAELPGGYSFYLAEAETWSGSERLGLHLVVTDLAELGWACARWTDLPPASITTVAAGQELAGVAALPGPLLPVGHPARVRGRVLHYGLTQDP